MIGAEPYITGNVGSGSVEEFSKWVEYTTFDGESPMANLRRKNGRDKPWKIKYWGIGNENWGCGGRMYPQYYSDLLRQYSNFVKNYGDNHVFKIAAGPSSQDTTWTSVVMRQAGRVINGISLHYYTTNPKPAAQFEEAGWFDVIKRTLRMDEIISTHSKIMDRYDPENKVALIIDEWGTWHAVEPGSNPAFLYQQNTMRDAIVAASNLNIFHKHCKRVKMTNIAQMINVLQAMILTDEEKMVLTPTYHVFEMYNVHQNAVNLSLDIKTAQYVFNNESVPAVNASASIASNGKIHISLCNVNPDQNEKITLRLDNFEEKGISARILTSEKMNALNSFDHPDNVKPGNFTDFQYAQNNLVVNMPSKSVIVFELDGQLNSKIGVAMDVADLQPQLKYTYHEGELRTLKDLDKLEVVREGLCEQINIPQDNAGNNFAVRYSGYIKIARDGFYNFYTNSDDGSKLYIDDKLIVQNDGRHGLEEIQGFVPMHKGFHKITVEYFQTGWGKTLEVYIEGPGMDKKMIPAEMLFH